MLASSCLPNHRRQLSAEHKWNCGVPSYKPVCTDSNNTDADPAKDKAGLPAHAFPEYMLDSSEFVSNRLG